MKKIISILIVLGVFYGLFQLLSQAPSNTQVPDDQTDMIFFWGEGCPHCENVKDYITEKKLNDRLKINQKEVYYKQQNKNQMLSFAQKCNIDTTNGIGVPFAYFNSDSSCLVGDQPIIDKLDQILSTKQ